MKATFDADSKWPLTLLGPPGVGKTCIARLCIHRVGGWRIVLRDEYSRYVQAQRGELRRGTPPWDYAVSLPDVWDSWMSPPLLVVDEIATRAAASENETDWLHSLIDRRVEANKALVLISNRTLDDLGSTYSAPIASRIAGGVVLEINGDDMRLAR